MNHIARSLLCLCSVFVATQVHAQAAAAEAHPVTVITLYSETRAAPGAFPRANDADNTPPIRVVNGGVNEPEGTCFDMDARGHITPAAGSCVVMRSADPGERPPAN
ncbi:conserved exported hypothetical protein [Paraburkholderia tropica]|uniref:hypothetical protein n=1 Tax=Paraburkholderia tropica TaxID=92647 RepID=UPI001CB63F16|nr:hypothetical protein [Paraburkholderia tropica]CAG9236913.1 conserved exported hypothetical protein [Paraburkholderia tropica]